MLPIHKSPAGFPMAPSEEEWAALSQGERLAVVDALPDEVTYEEMAPPEGDQHQNAKSRALDALRGYLKRQRREVYVTAELPVYYPKAPRFAPDLLVVFNVADHERGKWVVSAEGRGLDWVLEVHYGGDRKKDAERNVIRYAQHGIPEYFLFDRARGSLFAYRLATPAARVYTPIVPQRGLYASSVLGLDVAVEGDRLRFYAGTALLLESDELIGRLQARVDGLEERAKAVEAHAKELEAENARLRAAVATRKDD